MDSLLNSFLLVAATEMGDKTQLLALILASRFKRPAQVLAGIFIATVLNHVLAASVGSFISNQVSESVMRWLLALVFFAFAIWVLVPDQDEGLRSDSKYGAFFTTLIAFFFAEMGDKTQLSTAALAAHYQNLTLVTIGTTAGMMFSDGLAVFLGERLTQRISLLWVRRFSALLFLGFGVAILLS